MSSSPSDGVEYQVARVDFGVYGPEEIVAASVVEVTDTALYERGTPRDNAVNSLIMGSCDRRLRCKTCRHDVRSCPGHFGHISLVKPMWHVGYVTVVLKVLRSVCYWCSSTLVEDERMPSNRNSRRQLAAVSAMAKGGSSVAVRTCRHCGGAQPQYVKNGAAIRREWRGQIEWESEEEQNRALRPFTAEVAHEILRDIPDEQLPGLGFHDPNRSRPDWLIITKLVVPPPTIRPSVVVTDGSKTRGQDDLTLKLQDILKANIQLREAIEQKSSAAELLRLEDMLQTHLCLYLDKDTRVGVATKRAAPRTGPCKSLAQRLKGKKGRVRGNLMGKRVDFSSRSVITPEPTLDIDQIGVPQHVAVTQTFPEKVTPFNMRELQARVWKGSGVVGGAHSVIDKDGSHTNLQMCANRKSIVLEVGQVVNRTLKDGDWIVFNRQPSLHKESMMGHKVRIMSGNSFRLSVPCTTPYNADFDGDEMNMHVPQSVLASSEIQNMMAVTEQLVSPQKNSPCIGAVQDTVIGSFLLTSKDVFVEEHDMMDLTLQMKYSDRGMDLPEAAILLPAKHGRKPRRLYTGKQVVSHILPRINMRRKVRDLEEADVMDPAERMVVIRDGELLAGRLCKKTLGTSQGGIVHVTCLDLCNQRCMQFISDCQRVVCTWMTRAGFSVGIADCWVGEKTHADVSRSISKAFRSIQRIQNRDGVSERAREAKISQTLQNVLDTTGRIALAGLSPQNALRALVTSGSKGSNINISQISACIGQVCVSGKRIVPRPGSDRTLPSFRGGATHPMTGGFCSNSYAIGLRPQEFFTHAMGGREGLVDTAVKTAYTGYIQRRLVKVMEDASIRYDGTVRNSMDHIIQESYNGDGYAAERLERVPVPELLMSDAEIVRKYGPDEAPDIISLRKTVRDSKACHESRVQASVHVPVCATRCLENAKANDAQSRSVSIRVSFVREMRERVLRAVLHVFSSRSSAPLRLTLLTSLSWTSVSKMKITAAQLEDAVARILFRIRTGKVDPGTMVGAIAASSIGEPCTQMTLNTFHYAGVAKKSNVTRGVPRFKELIDYSKNIRTPTMMIYMSSALKNQQEIVERIALSFETATLKAVVSETKILWEPDPDRTAEIPEIDGCIVAMESALREKPLKDPSSCVIRMVLKKQAVFDLGIESVTAIRGIIEKTLEGRAEVLSSEHNMSQWIIRIRFVSVGLIINRGKLGEGVDAAELRSLETVAITRIRDSIMDSICIKGVSGVTAAIVSKESFSAFDENGNHSIESECMIETDGSNLSHIMGIDGVDADRTYSNDVHEVYETLGIEAASLLLYREMHNTLSFDGNYLNSRHLMMLVRTMTHNGFPCPVSRHGMRSSGLGTLVRASFEETVDVLTNAAMFADTDHCRGGVTEAVMFGTFAPIGTGAFELRKDETSKLLARKRKDQTTPQQPQPSLEFVGRRRGLQAANRPVDLPDTSVPLWKQRKARRLKKARCWNPRSDPRDEHSLAMMNEHVDAEKYYPSFAEFGDMDDGNMDPFGSSPTMHQPPASPSFGPPSSPPPLGPPSSPAYAPPQSPPLPAGESGFPSSPPRLPHTASPSPTGSEKIPVMKTTYGSFAFDRHRVYKPSSPTIGHHRSVYVPESPPLS